MTHTPVSAALYLKERGYLVREPHGTHGPPKADTIRRWCGSGKLPARQVGRTWLIEEAALDVLIESAYSPTSFSAAPASR